MKNLIIIILIVAGLGLTGCEEFLNEYPQSGIVDDGARVTGQTSTFTSLADIESALSGAYHNFTADIYQMQNYLIGDVMTDNCYVGGDGSLELQYDNVRLSPTNNLINIIWEQYFALVVSATDIIENIRLLEEGVIPESDLPRVTQIIAEAKFIRAWAYLDIVRLWGGAPLMLDLMPEITADNVNELIPLIFPERAPADEIYEQIFKDLDETEVIPLLDSHANGQFKATRGAAYGVLARAYISKGPKNERDYAKVVEYCDKVAAEGYSLEENFGTLWNAATNNSKESIFELDFTETRNNWAYWVLLTEESGRIVVTWRRYCTLTHELYDKFDRVKDKRFAESVYWAQVDYSAYWPKDNCPLAYKIRQKGSQIILMRLADIELLKAEALVELNRVGEAAAILNDIRERAGLGRDKSASMSQSDARLAVEQERQFELLLEGQRWFDLVRNDRLIEVMTAHKDADGNPFLKRPLEEYRTLLPLPQNELDVNSRLTQNPGYPQ